MNGYKYLVGYKRHYLWHQRSYTNDLNEAIELAQELDAVLSFGDQGISRIRNTEDNTEWVIGNGHYDYDDSPNWRAIV